VPLAIQD